MIDNTILHERFTWLEKEDRGEGYFKQKGQYEHQDIIKSLNRKFETRDYQFEAIGRLFYYYEDYKKRQPPYHLMFNMATGSGKTLIMAAAMLYLYKKGYRNFIFFTHLNNIIEKTKDNFLNPNSSKYLFAPEINLNTEIVEIKEVDNFNSASDEGINIMFTNISGLHTQWQNPKENELSAEDLEDKKIVLLADEAHHFSALTKKLKKEDRQENNSWEHTVLGNTDGSMGDITPGLLYVNPDNENILLEFTATLDWNDKDILEKYNDKVIYKYDLRKFRHDKYSKNIRTMQFDASYMNRALAAIVLSQYRLKVSQKYGIKPQSIKPVILFKSNYVNSPKDDKKTKGKNPIAVVSNDFKESFHRKIDSLHAGDIENIKNLAKANDNSDDSGSINLSKAFTFFAEQNISSANLAKEIQRDFAQENCISVDTTGDAEDKQIALNSLEDETNNIRAVFATEKLNEGWDVLNLFDIVRLYNSRSIVDGKPGRATNQEAQLIGRGARYCPLKTKDDEELHTRKFDDEPESHVASLEVLHYHCTYNPEYIRELNKELIKQGAKDEEKQQYIIQPKENLDGIPLSDEDVEIKWQDAGLFLNTRELRPKQKIGGAIEEAVADCEISNKELRSISSFIQDDNLSLDENSEEDKMDSNKERKFFYLEIADLGDNVLRQAIEHDTRTHFNNLQKHFSNIDSIRSLIEAIKQSQEKFEVLSDKNNVDELSQEEKLALAKEVTGTIFNNLFKYRSEYIGSTTFSVRKKLGEVFGEPVTRTLSKKVREEYGTYGEDKIRDLVNRPWFAQTNFKDATDQEVAFLRFIDSIYSEIMSSYEYFLVFRNDNHFGIYNFANEKRENEGEKTNPDFLLLLKKKNSKRYISHQVFVEAKGPQFLDDPGKSFKGANQGWKETFLESIGIKSKVKASNANITILGSPFFHQRINNKGNNKLYKKFTEYFKNELLPSNE